MNSKSKFFFLIAMLISFCSSKELTVSISFIDSSNKSNYFLAYENKITKLSDTNLLFKIAEKSNTKFYLSNQSNYIIDPYNEFEIISDTSDISINIIVNKHLKTSYFISGCKLYHNKILNLVSKAFGVIMGAVPASGIGIVFSGGFNPGTDAETKKMGTTGTILSFAIPTILFSTIGYFMGNDITSIHEDVYEKK